MRFQKFKSYLAKNLRNKVFEVSFLPLKLRIKSLDDPEIQQLIREKGLDQTGVQEAIRRAQAEIFKLAAKDEKKGKKKGFRASKKRTRREQEAKAQRHEERFMEVLEKELGHAGRGLLIEPDEWREIAAHLVEEVLERDEHGSWRALQDENGEEIEITPENVRKELLENPVDEDGVPYRLAESFVDEADGEEYVHDFAGQCLGDAFIRFIHGCALEVSMEAQETLGGAAKNSEPGPGSSSGSGPSSTTTSEKPESSASAS